MRVAAASNAIGRLLLSAVRAEVARAREKPGTQLDVFDPYLRAKVDLSSGGTHQADDCAATMKDLNRARAHSTDDPFTLQLTAQLNLCECVRAWAADNRPMEEIGVQALDKFLMQRPDSGLDAGDANDASPDAWQGAGGPAGDCSRGHEGRADIAARFAISSSLNPAAFRAATLGADLSGAVE